MNRKLGLSLVVMALAGMPMAGTAADLDFVVNALPASLLIDASGDKFSVSDAENGKVSLSEVYTMPNLAIGAGMPVGNAYVDLLGGGGIIINDGFRAFMGQILLEANWTVSDALDIGPRAGLIYFFDPEWLDSDSVEFEEDSGFLLGIGMAMGDKIKYLVSVDWIDGTMDVVSNGGAPSEDELDLSSLAIQFGVRGEF